MPRCAARSASGRNQLGYDPATLTSTTDRDRQLDEAPTSPGGEEEPQTSKFYSAWVVFVLTLVLLVSFLDRSILGLLVEPIKDDLGVSDTRMSLLLGLGFAAFYAIMGVPFGILADRTNRVRLIAAGLTLWTIATALSGAARSFAHLLVLRMGVGMGEATVGPAAPSIISDTVSRERRATAISIYSSGIYLGAGFASILGGLVAWWAGQTGGWTLPLIGAVKPWQMVFLVSGALGLVPLLLLLFTVREPEREGLLKAQPGQEATQHISLAESKAHYSKYRRAIGLHHLGFAAIAFSGYGVGSWLPAFFIRTHDWTIAQVGTWLGLNGMVTAVVGVVAGGLLADHWYKKGHVDAKMRVALLGAVLWFIPGIPFALVESGTLAYVLLAMTSICATLGVGCATAALHELMPNRLRGQAVAIYAVIANLIGLGIGPTAVALLTDYGFKDEQDLRYSILVIAVVCHVFAAIVLWRALKPHREAVLDLRASEEAA